MRIEIWSDVMCPFCYIGKRRFEEALSTFPQREKITVEWKSFQLDPSMRGQPGKSIHAYLAERKGMSLEEARGLNDRVTDMAAEAGLRYDFDKAVVANSFDAHRFAHLASAKGRGDEAEEALFRAYFTEGKDISDVDTLVQLGVDIGLDPEDVKQALISGAFGPEVHRDITEAGELGVQGVPFFVLDRKYAVSGAQPVATFAAALEKAYTGQEGQP